MGEPEVASESGVTAVAAGPRGDARAIGRLLKSAATLASTSARPDDAFQWALDLICQHIGWPLGHVYMVRPEIDALVSNGVWHVEDEERYQPFVVHTDAVALPRGIGLPGRILASGEPAWIFDVRKDPNFPRAPVAAQCGIGAGFGFPIVSSQGVEGVLEFFGPEPVEPDEDLLDLVAHVGLQLGNLFDRTRAQASLEASEARLRTLVELAPDALIVVDEAGLIVLVNEEMSRLSGYQPSELIGRPIELLVPSRSKAGHWQHRQGFLGAPQRRAMGAGIDLCVERRDGRSVPVDISLSPIDMAEGPVVIAAVRDISERKRAEDELRASEARLAEAQRISHVGSFSWEIGSDTVAWSDELFRIYGLDPTGLPLSIEESMRSVHPDDRDRVAATVNAAVRSLGAYEDQYRIVIPDGSIRWILARGEVVDSDGTMPRRIAGNCHDITEQRLAEDNRLRAQGALESHELVLERIARGEPLTATLETLCREFEKRYPAARCSVRIVDTRAGELRFAAGPSLPEPFTRAIDRLPLTSGMGAAATAAATNTMVVVDDVLTDPITRPFAHLAVANGLRSVWALPLSSAAGEVLGAFATYHSVPHRPDDAEIRTMRAATRLAALAIERSLAEEAITAAAQLDPLTGLRNRARFLELLTERLDQPGSRLAVMFLDLDRFKWINDSLGHPVGDRILVEVASRLEEVLGPCHVIARFGGDEFTILVDDASPDGIAAVASDVEGAFVDPFLLDGGEFFLTVSIGVALNDHPADAIGLIRDADAAMYAAKESGRARLAMFDERLRVRALARVTLETGLRHAIERGETVMHYQPIFDLVQQRWSGTEALVRWNHPTRGLVPPDEFIPLAEETGLIVPLGMRILEDVVAQIATWTAAGIDVTMAANVSVVQLSDPMLAADLTDVLRRHRVDPRRLILEITETAAVQRLETARASLERIAASGVRVVIDDFGTGYSSIARLGELPVVGIKIDRLFTKTLGVDASAAAVLGAVTDLAHAMSLGVVAEGIESEAALEIVAARGCDLAQGYHLSRPVPPEDIPSILKHPPLTNWGKSRSDFGADVPPIRSSGQAQS